MLLLGLTATLTAAAATRADLTMGFKSNIRLTRDDVRLGQLVWVRGDDAAAVAQLQAVPLGTEARPDWPVSISQERVLSIIAAEAPTLLAEIRWQGPDHAAVHVDTMPLDASALRTDAERVLRQWLSTRTGKMSVTPLTPDLHLPGVVGGASTMIRPVSGPIRSRMTVWIDVTHEGRTIESIPLWFAVSAVRRVCIAVRTVSPRAVITRRDVAVREMDVAPYAGTEIDEPQAVIGRRAIAPLGVGKVITQNEIRDSFDVEAGDDVLLRLQQGNLTLQTHGVALQSGQQGQSINIRLPRNGAMTVARVIGRDQAEMLP